MILILPIIGLVIGSFIAAWTWRISRGLSISSGRSICDKCTKKIDWFDNIPLLSYLIIHGKCRHCGKKIAIRYPIIEFAFAFGFTTLYLFNPGLNLMYLLVIFTCLTAIFITDIEEQIIPDVFVFILLLVIAGYVLVVNPSDVYISIFTGFAAGLFFLILNLVTLGRGMGLGDVKLAVVLGIFLGWPMTIVWMFSSFLTGAITGIILILFGKASFGKHIAFGPFMIISLFLALFFGQDILKLFF